ncbi:MAG: DUF1848 domain-containing protein [Chloroflexi bacterium]|nr:DUF1848 domain-containing protein [Chloroflexota bacterium]
MPFAYSRASYTRYLEAVGADSYLDLTRRTDPARWPRGWQILDEMLREFGAPWVLQLWTKDPHTVALAGRQQLEQLRQHSLITAQVTDTGLAGSFWEPGVPAGALDSVSELASLIGGTSHINWRYDPIIPTVHRTDTFRALAERAAALGIRRATINFISQPGTYRRVDRRLASRLPGWAEGMPGYDLSWQADQAHELLAIAQPLGIRLAVCAESAGLVRQVPGLAGAACGDRTWFSALSGHSPSAPVRASRKGCGCLVHYDLGSYGNWTRCHGCIYCYAG